MLSLTLSKKKLFIYVLVHFFFLNNEVKSNSPSEEKSIPPREIPPWKDPPT